jgi:DNA-binding transcriptional LysR family regulator
MNLSLKQLKVFLGVADTSSFTKTAQAMHLSQAAMSAIIRELETQLECRLFERTTRIVSLTEAGRMFYPTAASIVTLLEKSVIELNELARQSQSSLLIGCTPMVAASLMPPVLARFARLYPESRIELVDRTPGDLVTMVEAGHLDAAYGLFFSQLSGIDRTPVFNTRFVSVFKARPGSARWGDGIKWGDLRDHTLVTLSNDNPLQRLIESSLPKVKAQASRRIVVSHLQTAIAMAQEGLGVAIMPSFCQHACDRYEVQLQPLLPEVSLSFYRISRSGRGRLDTLDRFTDLFAELTNEAR